MTTQRFSFRDVFDSRTDDPTAPPAPPDALLRASFHRHAGRDAAPDLSHARVVARLPAAMFTLLTTDSTLDDASENPTMNRGARVAVLPVERFVIEKNDDEWIVYDFAASSDPEHDPNDIDAALQYLSEHGTLEGSPHVVQDARAAVLLGKAPGGRLER